MNESNKIRPEHLSRGAYLYVRQSSLRQVRENRESTARQYDLKRRVRSWDGLAIASLSSTRIWGCRQQQQKRPGDWLGLYNYVRHPSLWRGKGRYENEDHGPGRPETETCSKAGASEKGTTETLRVLQQKTNTAGAIQAQTPNDQIAPIR